MKRLLLALLLLAAPASAQTFNIFTRAVAPGCANGSLIGINATPALACVDPLTYLGGNFVKLQGSFPGTQQTGSHNVSGNVGFGPFLATTSSGGSATYGQLFHSAASAGSIYSFLMGGNTTASRYDIWTRAPAGGPGEAEIMGISRSDKNYATGLIYMHGGSSTSGTLCLDTDTSLYPAGCASAAGASIPFAVGTTGGQLGFAVDPGGNINRLRGVSQSWPTALPGSTACLRITNAGVVTYDTDCGVGVTGVSSVTGSGGTTGLTLTGGPTGAVTLTLGGSLIIADTTLPHVGTPTDTNSGDDWFRHSWSTGLTDGGAITLNGGAGTVDVAANDFVTRQGTNEDSPLKVYRDTGTTGLALTANEVSYVYRNYNGGSPTWAAGTALSDFNGIDKTIAFAVARNGTAMQYLDARAINVDAGRKVRRKNVEWSGYTYNGFWQSVLGTSTVTPSGLKFNVAAGKYFWFENPHTHAAVNTAAAGTFTYFYNRTPPWTQVAAQTDIDATQYDNAGTLTTMSNNKWRTDWMFVVLDDGGSPYVAVVMGNTQYNNQALAQAEAPPAIGSGIPHQFDGMAVLLGQVTIQKSATGFTFLQAGSATFSGGGGSSGVATALADTTGQVDVSASAAPSTGQTLVATDATHATWQTLSGTGTVTSVATTAPITGGTITTTGTIGISIDTTNDGGAVAKQATTPGTQQTGNLNVSGTAIAGTLRATNAGIGAVPTAPLTVSENVTAMPTTIAGTEVTAAAADGTVTRALLESFGAANAFSGRRANNTAGSPSGVVNNDVLTQLTGLGYTSAGAYSAGARADVQLLAAETWSSSNQGAKGRLRATPTGGSTTIQTSVEWDTTYLTLASGMSLKFPDGTTQATASAGGSHSGTGAVGSEPAASSGDLYLPNNSYTVERYSGSAWVSWGPIFPLTQPPLVTSGVSTTQGNNGGSITNVATSVIVSSSSGFPSTPFLVKIDSEDIKVTTVAGTTWTIVRAYNGTTGASHTDGATITLLNWEWNNQGGASVTQMTNGGFFLLAPATAGNQMRTYKRLIGNTSTGTLTIAFVANNLTTTSGVAVHGIVMRESGTDKRSMFLSWSESVGPRMAVSHCANATFGTYVNDAGPMYWYPTSPTFLRVAISGSNYVYSLSADGQNWIIVKTIAKTTQFTAAADEWGVFVNAGQANQDIGITLISWTES